MPVPTRRDLQNRIKELESENEDLQSRIDEISDIVTGNDDAEEEDEEGEDEDTDLGNDAAPSVGREMEEGSTPDYRPRQALPR